jgi:hypothetical protein
VTAIALDNRPLDLPWERWTDGRIWRLKRGRDFPHDVDAQAVVAAAELAAARMGKAIRTARDPAAPEKYCWLQFADHEIPSDEACPCGGRVFQQLHTNFARCQTCKALLVIGPPTASSTALKTSGTKSRLSPKQGKSGAPLSAYRDVHLERYTPSARTSMYRGYGRIGTTQFLLMVRFKIDSTHADPTSLDRAAIEAIPAVVRATPMPWLDGIADTHAFLGRDRESWDIVLE